MARKSDAQHALESALGNLWCIQEMAEEAMRFEGFAAGLAVWQRNAPDCQRWVMVVGGAGQGHKLPPHLLNNKAFFNAHDWRIP